MNKHAVSPSERVISIDALRGFDMFLIIGGGEIIRRAIEVGGAGFPETILSQFRHVSWEGFAFWDLIMPLFLFIVGAAMPFAFGKRLERGDDKKEIYLHVLRRVVILFALGMIAQGHLLEFNADRLHVYCNTLQAIAAGYLIAAILMLNFGLAGQLTATAGLLVGFWVLMLLVPQMVVIGGVFEPESNAAIYIDRLLLGRFDDGTTYTWILSSMTFGCSVMLGVFAGRLLRSQKSQLAKFGWLMGAGFGCVVAGLFWGIWFPIIKHIWTSSFVLFAGGLSFLLLGIFYLVIDIWGWRKWAFGFVVIGMNAIVVYMATHVFDFKLMADPLIGGLAKWTGDWQGVLRPATAFAIVWGGLYWLYRNKTFIRI